jgi:hypothetical protein
MDDIKELLGKRYTELKSVELFGTRVPLSEEIEGQSYVDFREAGVSVVLPDNETIGAVHLHSAGHEGFRGYAGPLPRGLKFAMSRKAVRALFGEPEASHDEQTVPVLGWKSAWDSFVVDSVRIHIAYSRGGSERIELVTLTKA